MGHSLISQLPIALNHVFSRRKKASPNDSIWDLLFHRERLLPRLDRALRTGLHRFEPVEIFRSRADGEWIERWTAADAVILKAIALFLSPILERRLSSRCFHLRGRGGAKGVVRELHAALAGGTHRFVFRSDVYHYYESLDHAEVLHALNRIIPYPPLLRLVAGFLDRTLYRAGHYRSTRRGIGRGSPLSPLLGAVYLAEMDEALSHFADRHGLFYLRFMDDWILLAPTRWKLRKAIRITNQCLAVRKVRQHPDKTFIGRVERGFDFLGYHFDDSGLDGLSGASVHRFFENLIRRAKNGHSPSHLSTYLRRWWGWATGGWGKLDVGVEIPPLVRHHLFSLTASAGFRIVADWLDCFESELVGEHERKPNQTRICLRLYEQDHRRVVGGSTEKRPNPRTGMPSRYPDLRCVVRDIDSGLGRSYHLCRGNLGRRSV